MCKRHFSQSCGKIAKPKQEINANNLEKSYMLDIIFLLQSTAFNLDLLIVLAGFIHL